jgi:hypothetical protein
MAAPKNCRRCKRPFDFRRCPTCSTPKGIKPYRRGLCASCTKASREDGTLHNYPTIPPPGRPRGPLVEEFEHIVEGRRAPTVTGWDTTARRAAASQLGVKLATLDRALSRARAAERGR